MKKNCIENKQKHFGKNVDVVKNAFVDMIVNYFV